MKTKKYVPNFKILVEHEYVFLSVFDKNEKRS